VRRIYCFTLENFILFESKVIGRIIRRKRKFPLMKRYKPKANYTFKKSTKVPVSFLIPDAKH
jgi:hypothetical protein